MNDSKRHLGFVVAIGFAAEALGNAVGVGEVGDAMGGGDGDVPVSGVILRSPQMVSAAGVVCGRGNRSLSQVGPCSQHRRSEIWI